MVEIKAQDGCTVLSRSRNLAGLRRAARKYDVRIVTLNLLENGRGELRVWFTPNVVNGKYYGALCVTEFESFVVLCGFVQRWRAVYGAEAFIAGLGRGLVGDEPAQGILKHVLGWGPSPWMKTKRIIESARMEN